MNNDLRKSFEFNLPAPYAGFLQHTYFDTIEKKYRPRDHANIKAHHLALQLDFALCMWNHKAMLNDGRISGIMRILHRLTYSDSHVDAKIQASQLFWALNSAFNVFSGEGALPIFVGNYIHKSSQKQRQLITIADGEDAGANQVAIYLSEDGIFYCPLDEFYQNHFEVKQAEVTPKKNIAFENLFSKTDTFLRLYSRDLYHNQHQIFNFEKGCYTVPEVQAAFEMWNNSNDSKDTIEMALISINHLKENIVLHRDHGNEHTAIRDFNNLLEITNNIETTLQDQVKS